MILNITVINGRKLPCLDKRLIDPYIVLKYGRQIQKTQVVKKSTWPNWNETFTFNRKNDSDVTVELWDEVYIFCF
jgi:Ca2+-dependent lipid-binding protein